MVRVLEEVTVPELVVVDIVVLVLIVVVDTVLFTIRDPGATDLNKFKST